MFDELDPLEKEKTGILKQSGIQGGRAEMKALRDTEQRALEMLSLPTADPRRAELAADPLVKFLLNDSVANVICPATKLWNTGHGANMMREAVSLMGGYGITEDCPGFLATKWMDAQLEATYEGPEAVQRRQLSVTMTDELFLAQFRQWIREMRLIANDRPETGACSLATAMQLWLWSLNHLQKATDADGAKLYQGSRQGVTFPLADALCWLLSSRCQILDLLELEKKGPELPTVAEGCASCYQSEDLECMEALIPGIASLARGYTDVIEPSGAHESKAGPCVRFHGLEQFATLRIRMDGCLTGSQLAKDRAADALTKVMIPEALDYPV
jgi:hypothetical protein